MGSFLWNTFDTVTIIKEKNDENTFIFRFDQDSLHYSKGGMFSVEASAGSKDGVITVEIANNWCISLDFNGSLAGNALATGFITA